MDVARRIFSLPCGITVLALAIAGCDLFPAPVSTSNLAIRVERVGCSEGSRSARFTAVTEFASATFQWFFTDGVVLTGSEVIHTFERRQSYDVVLRATLPDSREETARRSFTIPAPGSNQSDNDVFGDRCVPNEGAQHVAVGTDVQYVNNPPASGPHYSAPGVAPIAAGVYDTEIQPEVWVHNLEHGDVVFLYDCPGDCSSEFLDQLQALFDAVPPRFGKRKLVVTRYPGLGPFMMAVAWNTQRDFDALDTEGLVGFYTRHVGGGPEDLP